MTARDSLEYYEAEKLAVARGDAIAVRKLDRLRADLLIAHFAEAAAIMAAKPKGLLVAPRLMEVAYARLLRQMVAQGWAAPRVRVKVSKLRLALAALRFSLLG